MNQLLKTIAFGATIAACASADAASVSHIGTSQKVLIICVKYSDVATTRKTRCQDWADSMQNEINTFYNRSTFGRTTFDFDAAPGPSDGWYDLGLASTDYDFFGVAQAAVTLADADVNFANYNRVAVLTNFDGFGGQGGGPWWWTVNDGIEATEVMDGVEVGRRLMTMSITNEWVEEAGFGVPQDDSNTVTAHEIGHQLGAPTHYADIRWSPGIARDVMTPWGIMGLSPTMNHFIGWAKDNRDWTQSGFVRTVGPPSGSNINELVRLRPIERAPSGSNVQVIRVPLAISPTFVGYVIELRRQVNGDEQLPSTGILISYVDERPDNILKLVVLDDPSMPGDLSQSPLDLGETFLDPGFNLSITYESDVGAEDANVRIQYNLAPSARPNPSITPWGAPPWETVDIWIDSEKNGWDTYRYTDGAGNPTGNGDDAWVDHANRVKLRVTNSGGLATNVRAQVYVNSPPGMGDAGANWDYLGTIVFPSIAAGASATGFVNWTPKVGEHTCIKVVILETPGETSTSDNLAQENVTKFDTSSASPFKPVSIRVQVNNPFADNETPVRYHIRDVPAGWTFMLVPREAVLPPGGSDSVLLTVFPSGVGKVSEQIAKYRAESNRIGFIGKLSLEAQVPYADTYVPIGGVDVWTHLVEKTQLTCRVGNLKLPKDRPRIDPRFLKKGQFENRSIDWGFNLSRSTFAPRGGDTPLGQVEKSAPPAPVAQLRKPSASLPKGSLFGGTGKVLPVVAAARAQIEATSLLRPEPDPTIVSDGDLIDVSGGITPPFAGAKIAVEIRNLDGERYVDLVETDHKGLYHSRLKPLADGEAVVKAYFAGDRQRGPSESKECRLIAQ